MAVLYVILIIIAGLTIAAVAMLTFAQGSRKESTGEDLKANADASAVVIPQQGLNLPGGTESPSVGQEPGDASNGETHPAGTTVEGDRAPMAKAKGQGQPVQEADGQAQDAEEEEEESEREESPDEDGILSLFKSEQVEDLDLEALTQGLEDIDARELLKECQNVANQLRQRLPKPNQTRKAT